jgi:hypothetical protein
MSTIKTLPNNSSAEDFINSVDDDVRRQDSLVLLKLFTDVTGEPAKMWGTSIVGFGMYHYKSERSRQEGDWPLIGFSPRKQSLTLYMMQGFDGFADLLSKLGKHKISAGSCLYINKLADVDMVVLEELVRQSYKAMKQAHSA